MFLHGKRDIFTFNILSVDITGSTIPEDFEFRSEDEDDDKLIPARLGRCNEMGEPSGTVVDNAEVIAEEVEVQDKGVDINMGCISAIATDIDHLSVSMAAASNSDGRVDANTVEMTVDSVSLTCNQVGMY